MYVRPPHTSNQSVDSIDCLITITTSTEPEVVGRQVYEEYFRVKVPDGATITTTAARTGGEEGFDTFITYRLGKGVTVQEGVGKTVTWKNAAGDDAWVLVSVAGTLRWTDASKQSSTANRGTYALDITMK